ncbi:hypothetical protein E2C01_075850 [Portunus trituberculatus]|uniref:Uncharacterized protein n=1 Tax=Portunus trituberculatus TaxID=210409 RepID=A0A5B7IG12_PORTR|nr:hypothetical protein [Portunus trituberculatus]
MIKATYGPRHGYSPLFIPGCCLLPPWPHPDTRAPTLSHPQQLAGRVTPAPILSDDHSPGGDSS